MAANIIIVNNDEILNLSNDTVTPAKLLKGETAHDKSGAAITGTYETPAAVTQATPTITVSSSGLITAKATQAAGAVAAGTKQATKQLTTQPAKTITPGTTAQTAVASGRYTTGAVTVKGDANLIPANIKKGVSIFGKTGTYEGSGGGSGGGPYDYVFKVEFASRCFSEYAPMYPLAMLITALSDATGEVDMSTMDAENCQNYIIDLDEGIYSIIPPESPLINTRALMLRRTAGVVSESDASAYTYWDQILNRDAFADDDPQMGVFVPDELVDAYKESEYWSDAPIRPLSTWQD